MTIHTVSNLYFELKNAENKVLGSIRYGNTAYAEAEIRLPDKFELKLIANGIWVTIAGHNDQEKILTNIRVETGGAISIRKFYRRKKYIFKKSVNWKQRFSLSNADGDELMALLPAVNWENGAHNFILQVDEAFEKECDAFLILQALHCAVVSLSMMTGGSVPALISV